MAKFDLLRWTLIPALTLLFSISILPAAADEGAIPWPKSCPYAPAPYYISPDRKAFCLNFVADYFYRLRFTSETHTFKSGDKSQQYQRPQLSTEGALFMATQAQVESGWGHDPAPQAHNYWGLGGAQHFMHFTSFEAAFAYLMNHFDRGITAGAEIWPGHHGWPGFIDQMTKETVDPDEINRALRSGPYGGKGGYAYNTDYDPKNCPSGKPGAKDCPYLNYAHIIHDSATPVLVSNCLAVYEKYPDEVPASVVYGKDEPVSPLDRRRAVRDELVEYARGKCGLSSKEGSTGAAKEGADIKHVEIEFALGSSVVRSVTGTSDVEALTISGHPIGDCGGDLRK